MPALTQQSRFNLPPYLARRPGCRQFSTTDTAPPRPRPVSSLGLDVVDGLDEFLAAAQVSEQKEEDQQTLDQLYGFAAG